MPLLTDLVDALRPAPPASSTSPSRSASARRCSCCPSRSPTRRGSAAASSAATTTAARPGPGTSWRSASTSARTSTRPIHWITGRDGEDVASVPPARLVGPAVVIDKSAEAAAGPRLPADRRPGARVRGRARRDPRGRLAAAAHGLGRPRPRPGRVPQRERRPAHTPGIDAECARWLAQESPVVGVGVETVGTDAGAAGGFDPPFPVHHFLLGAGKYGLTQLANLAELPPVGAVVVVAPLKLVGGTGSPTRALALVGA